MGNETKKKEESYNLLTAIAQRDVAVEYCQSLFNSLFWNTVLYIATTLICITLRTFFLDDSFIAKVIELNTVPVFINFVIYFLCYYLFVKIKSYKRKIYIFTVYYGIVTFMYAMYSVRFLVFSIFTFVLIVYSIPFEKKFYYHNVAVSFVSIFLISIWHVIQYKIKLLPEELSPWSLGEYLITDALNLILIASILTAVGAIRDAMNSLVIKTVESTIENQDKEKRLITDALTGLKNQLGLIDFWDKMDTKQYQTIAFLDVDNFKRYNDCYNYEMGDNILRAVSQCLYIQPKDGELFRTHGDEFIAVTKLTPEELKTLFTNKQRKFKNYCKTNYVPDEEPTASIGIIEINYSKSLTDNVTMATEYLHKAKGGNGRDTGHHGIIEIKK